MSAVEAGVSTPEAEVIFVGVTGGNDRHNADALILSARPERIPVVTEGQRLTKHCAIQVGERVTASGPQHRPEGISEQLASARRMPRP